nr:putative disease resistance RPP13-like protein 3 [Ipomoea batatas]
MWQSMRIQSKVCKRLSPEFEKIGREIVEKCKGLPLAIIVTAGLLSNSNQTFIHEWEHIAKYVPALSLDHSNQQGENIIYLSYTFLPHHLKLCFLSFGCFPEDDMINESRIVDFWVSEGFLKVLKSESLEDVARKNLQDLVDRNLVLFCRYTHGVEFYQMHDVLRELVLREVQKENLLCSKKGYTISLRWKRNQSINSSHISQPWSVQSRICSYNTITPTNNISSLMGGIYTSTGVGAHAQFKFIRVFAVISEVINVHNIFLKIVGLVHLRYLCISCGLNIHYLPLFMLGNLQKLEVGVYSSCEPLDIWGLPQLKNINIHGTITLVPPRSVHHNLESIRCLDYRSCTKELFLRIPNLRTLEVTTNPKIKCKAPSWFESLVYLYKLEVLMVDAELEEFSTIYSMGMLSLENILPNLKELNLSKTNLKWEDMDVVESLISSVERIQKEQQEYGNDTFVVDIFRIWVDTNAGMRANQYSMTEASWISSGFANIFTLKSIKFWYKRESLISYAEHIQKEQQEYGNDTFVVDMLRVGEYDEAMKGLEAQLRDVSVELRFQIEHQLRLFYVGKSMKLRLHSAQKLLPILKEAIKGGIETMDFNSVMEILGKHFTLPTLEVYAYSSCEPLDIWGLPQLKNILIFWNMTLVHPRSVHHNLESITCLDYRSCTKELFLRIPNLRTLDVTTNPKIKCKAPSWFESLVYLYKLEVLKVEAELGEFSTIYSMGMLSLENFLPNLKELNLSNTNLKWKDMDVVEIATLKSIKLSGCLESLISSAERIQKEQQEYGNDTFVVDIERRSQRGCLEVGN